MTDKGALTPLDIFYGFRSFGAAGNLFMAYNFGFTAATLETALQKAGFTQVTVERDSAFNLWGTASTEKQTETADG